MTQTLQELQSLISSHFGVPAAQLDPALPMDALGLDSLGVIELMFNIEDHYNIKMPESGPQVATLNELANWVDSVRAGGGNTLQQ